MLYQHYKGQLYTLVCKATCATNGPTDQQEMVVYTDGKNYFCRESSEFFGDVSSSGESVKRFTLVDPGHPLVPKEWWGISHKEYQDRRIQHIQAGYSEPTAEDLERVRDLFNGKSLSGSEAEQPQAIACPSAFYDAASQDRVSQECKTLNRTTSFVPIDVSKIQTFEDIVAVIGALQIQLDPAAHPNMSKYLVGAPDDAANSWIFCDGAIKSEVLRVTKEGYFIWAEHALARINSMGENEGALKAILLALYKQLGSQNEAAS